MDKIKIITDTASDITMEDAKKFGIHLIPINFTIEGKSIKDRIDISYEQFYKYIETCEEIPKTSQITVSEHIDEFKKFSDEYSIIYVPISSKASGTFQSANIAKNEILEENPNADITIIDPLTFSFGYGYWIIQAAKMVKNGESKEKIILMLEESFPKTEIILAPKTLKYLEKGGRISPSAKIIASVLDITPILRIEDGLVMSLDKVRGSKKVIPRLIEILQKNALPDADQTIMIIHGNVPETAEKMKEKLLEKTDFKNFVIAEIGPCVGIHTGSGVIALGYIKK